MRKLIAVAAVLAITSAHAAEELKFGDVNYFLKQGQKNVTADISQTFYKQNDKNQTPATKTVTRGYLLDTTLGYAFTDRLNAFVGLSYAYDLKTDDKTTTSNGKFYSDGLANPAVGLNFRLQNQNEAMYNVDFGAVARINVQDSEKGSSVGQSKEDGNFADGRNSLELNARMGRKWNEANEWQLAVGGIYHQDGETTLNASAGDTDIDEDSSYDLFLRATYQYRPVNEFMVLTSLQATQVGERDIKPQGASKDTLDAHTNFDFKFTAKYLVTDNVIGKFNWGVSHLGKIETKNETITNRLQNFFGFGVDYLF